MKFNRRFFAVLLSLCIMLSLAAPAAAAELTATYGEASYYDIAITNYSRMLLFQNGVVPAADSSKLYGLIDATGRTVVPFQYKHIFSLGGGLFKVSDSTANYATSWSIIDSTGKTVLPTGEYIIDVQNDTIRVTNRSDYSEKYYNLSMQASTKAAYDGGASPLDAYDWVWPENGYYVASKYDSNTGESQNFVLNSSYQPVLPAQSDYIEIASGGGTTLFISGNKVFTTSGSETSFSGLYDFVEPDYRGSAILRVSKDGQQGAVDFNGKVLVPLDSYTMVCGQNQQGYIAAVNYEGYGENESGYISRIYKDGALVKTLTGTRVATEAYYRDMIFTLEGQETWGVMDIDEKVIVPARYNSIESDGNGNLLTAVYDSNTWSSTYGLYSNDGKQYFSDGHSEIRYLTENKYKLCLGGRYGVSRLDGTAVIPMNYQDMRIHTMNFVELYDGTCHSVVDLSNQVIVPASKEPIQIFHSRGNESLGDALYSFEENAEYYNNYKESVLPFCYQLADGSYATVYADYQTGKPQNTLPVRASNINADGAFVYQAANGLYGFASVGEGTGPSTPPPAQPSGDSSNTVTDFADVPAGSYYAAPVLWASKNNIVKGTGGNAFSPDNTCTNAEILTFLWRAYGQPEPAIANPFSNVTESDFFYKPALWAYERGMISGDTFSKDTPCTRATTAMYLWQAAGSPAPAGAAEFSDVSSSADYAQAVAWAVEHKITGGTGNNQFSPDKICTRAEIVTFLHRNMA